MRSHSVALLAVRVLALLLLMVVSGCGAKHYRKSADKEAAKVIAQKTPAVPNMDPNFTIEQTNVVSLAGLPKVERTEDFLGIEKEAEVGASILGLEEALAIAVKHSREYQNQKEIVYLEALSLTLSRHLYTPLFSSGGNVSVQNQPKDVARAIDEVAGTQTSLVQQDTKVVQQYNVSGRGTAGASVLLRSGATLAQSFTIDFLRFLNGEPRFLIGSTFSARLTQPLLRGFGYKVTMENLTQAERNLLYALRDFTQYRKEFSVQIAQSYYRVLQARDTARNQYLGYQNFLLKANKDLALADEGRKPKAELGQIQQATLSAEAGWVSAVRSYKQNLDRFKMLLGLPSDAPLVLDDRELANLRILHPDLGAEEATKVALATRLDLQTAKNRVEDAERKTKVAASGLKPRMDLVVSGTLNNKPGSNNPLDVDTQRARGSAGLEMDLALDRKQQRNVYRQALITKERSAREYQLREDQIKLQVHDNWRSLDEARRTHGISELGVKLAEKRVEELELLTELGRGQNRDLVEAQTALISSRNERTRALVDHTIARLQFWRDMGILFIKENGQWEEVANAK